MSKLSRRKLFALGGAGLAVAGGTGAHGAEIVAGDPGITIKIALRPEGWMVAVPDWDNIPEYASPHRGFIMAIKWIPLNEFLVKISAEGAE